jgi:hypothetical protein
MKGRLLVAGVEQRPQTAAYSALGPVIEFRWSFPIRRLEARLKSRDVRTPPTSDSLVSLIDISILSINITLTPNPFNC